MGPGPTGNEPIHTVSRSLIMNVRNALFALALTAVAGSAFAAAPAAAPGAAAPAKIATIKHKVHKAKADTKAGAPETKKN
jgi:hypothetical protein